jgi:preprotein translocase subunit SecG
MSHLWSDIFSILFALASIFLIFIVLLQRGRGGGLAGAFGATGGQSAFGTKAGDVFTRITIGVAVVWVALAGITGFAMSKESKNRFHSEAVEEPGVTAATPGQQGAGGGGVGKFEEGNQPNGKAGTAINASTPGTGTTAPPSSKSPSNTKSAITPPVKSSPAPDTTKSSAPAK